MPNHITNLVRIHADEETKQAIRDRVGSSERPFDFERIIPRSHAALESIARGEPGALPVWYTEGIREWGTKWNAYGFDDYRDRVGVDFAFETAWSAPEPIYRRLSEMFSDVRIEVEYADENIGSNCGRSVFLDGKEIEEFYPAPDEADDFAYRVIYGDRWQEIEDGRDAENAMYGD